MQEKDLEAKLKARLEDLGGLCLKWTSPGFTGVPDRICFFPDGRVVFVELKRPGRIDGASPRQKRVAGQLRALGQDVRFIRTEEEIDELCAASVSDIR